MIIFNLKTRMRHSVTLALSMMTLVQWNPGDKTRHAPRQHTCTKLESEMERMENITTTKSVGPSAGKSTL